MKQPNFIEKIIIISIEGISMGILSVMRILLSLILRLLFGTNALAANGLADTIKNGTSPRSVETADFDNDKFGDSGKTYASKQINHPDEIMVLLVNAKNHKCQFWEHNPLLLKYGLKMCFFKN